jgi:uncharacterized protein (DUF2235 family)
MLAKAFELCGGGSKRYKSIKEKSIGSQALESPSTTDNTVMAPPDASERPSRPQAPRRLVLCFDGIIQGCNANEGTWFNSISLANQVRDNISTIAQSVLPNDSHGIPQIVYYVGGCGTGSGMMEKLWGAASGFDNKDYVKDGYMFLVNNYVPGAEIYLFGWSRGAYAARVVSGILSDVGLLKITGVEYFSAMFDAFFTEGKLTKDQVPGDQLFTVHVECCGVWETVGSEGIPNSSVLGWGLPIVNTLIQKWNQRDWYQFLNSALPSKSRVGLQAYLPMYF